jgi:hypothetical protein
MRKVIAELGYHISDAIDFLCVIAQDIAYGGCDRILIREAALEDGDLCLGGRWRYLILGCTRMWVSRAS